MRCVLAILMSIAVAAPAGAAELRDQVFEHYAPQVTGTELPRRVFTPLQYAQLLDEIERAGRPLSPHTVDLTEERFDLFVPERQPEAGYGLLVFVSPMPALPVQREWKYTLNRAGIIYVAARRSGNEQGVFARRIPLALHAFENVNRRYPIDPDRVWAGGYSGGGKVATRLALSFPDVFRGAMLVAGSMVLGELGVAPSPPELMSLFQQRSRLAFATGAKDLPNIAIDLNARKAFEAYCVFALEKLSMPSLGHHLPDARAFANAIRFLDRPPATPSAQTEACRVRLQTEAEQAIAAIEAAIASGDLNLASERLVEADRRYGGLVGEQVVALHRRLQGER